MGLMDQATSLAAEAQSEAQVQAIERQRAAGVKAAERFTELFGLEAEWIDQVLDVSYQKRYRDFGGAYWSTNQTNRHRLRVDDVTLGAGDKDKYVIYLPCSHCTQTRAFDLGYVSLYGGTEKALPALLGQIGKLATSKRECTHCQAQPCDHCGAVR